MDLSEEKKEDPIASKWPGCPNIWSKYLIWYTASDPWAGCRKSDMENDSVYRKTNTNSEAPNIITVICPEIA